jgi:protein TonB
MTGLRFLPAFALTLALLAGPSALSAAEKLRLSGNVAQANLVRQTPPVYPPEAKHNHIQGLVRIDIEIGTDGSVTRLTVVSGSPELTEAALTAVSTWLYRPFLLNGEPVEVSTSVDVNFTLVP